MTTGTKKDGCKCRVCLYGQKITDLVDRTSDKADKALIEELYNNLMHAEDNRDFHSTKNEGCEIKHGGISFSDAVNVIDAHRSKKEKAVK
jgi:hypothetical protein